MRADSRIREPFAGDCPWRVSKKEGSFWRRRIHDDAAAGGRSAGTLAMFPLASRHKGKTVSIFPSQQPGHEVGQDFLALGGDGGGIDLGKFGAGLFEEVFNVFFHY